MVVATTVATLMLVIGYLCPWRIEASNELQWSPIYQEPMSYVRSYDTEQGAKGSSRIDSGEAHIAVGFLALEVLAVGAAGAILYFFFSNTESDEITPPG